MSKNDSTVSKAEQYRKERKERIAKSAKKSSKKNFSGNADSSALVATIIKVVFAVAVVALVSGLLLNNFGVLDRVLTVGKVGDARVSRTEYSYQIRTTYTQLCSMAEQYSQQYGMNVLGFDPATPPEDQPYTQDDEMPEDEEAAKDFELDKYETWMDYIADQAMNAIRERRALVSEAEKAGFKLTDEEFKQIDEDIKSLEEQVISSGETSGRKITLKGYLKQTYGKGMTVEMFKELETGTQTASKFVQYKNDELHDSYADADIKEVYDADTTAYDVVDYRSYSVAYSDEKAEDGSKTLSKEDAEKRANEFLSKIKEEADFNKTADEYAKADDKNSKTYEDADATLAKNAKSSDLSSMDTDGKIKEWLYSKDRKAGDKKVFELASSYFVVYVVKPAHEIYAYNSRHILVQYQGEADQMTGQTSKATDDDWKALKAEADKILKEWKDGAATEDSFAELAEKYSDDGGSNTNGGLYEDVEPGNFVASYENWCLDPARKEGDVTIVKEDGSYQGYHIIYFKGINDKPVWNSTIRSEKATEDYEKYHDEVLDGSFAYTSNAISNAVLKSCRKEAAQLFRANAEQSANSAAAQQYAY